MDRSRKYILPHLKMDDVLEVYISNLEPAIKGVYIGVDDIVENSTYILLDGFNKDIDTKVLDMFVKSTLIKSHKVVGDFEKDNLILIEIENKVEGLNDHFLNGQYSKMYTKDQYDKLFPYPQRKIFGRRTEYRESLGKQLGVVIAEDAELDSKPELKQEIYYTSEY